MIPKDLPSGCLVYLESVPQSLLDGLPIEDQEAIQAMVGKTITLVEYRNDHVECDFVYNEDTHTIWIDAVHLGI